MSEKRKGKKKKGGELTLCLREIFVFVEQIYSNSDKGG